MQGPEPLPGRRRIAACVAACFMMYNRRMSDAYAPRNIHQWQRRILSLPVAFFVLAIGAALVVELRFDWIETVIGTYMVSTNAQRPESGAVWEQGHRAATARQDLATFVARRQQSQREARNAANMAQLINSLTIDQGAMVSADHFTALYMSLPPMLAREIISPFQLLSIASQGRWQRTYFERQADQVNLYLLDDRNQVVSQLTIGADLLSHVRRGEVAVGGDLAHLADFAGTSYEPTRFFKVLETMTAADRQAVMAHPEDLLKVGALIRRVGISRETADGLVDLGFEIQDAEGTRVLLVQGKLPAVRRLQLLLDGRSDLPWGSGGLQKRWWQ